MDNEIITLIIVLIFFFTLAILFVFLAGKQILKKNIKNNKSNKDHSTKFTLKGKEYNNLSEYFGEFKKRSPESLKKIFDALPSNPDDIKRKIDESTKRIKNIMRNIAFVIFLIIFMGVVYYYLMK